MDKTELENLIKEGVDQWNKKRPKPQQPINGTSADKYLDISGFDLSNLALQNIDLSNTKLSDVSLENTNLNGADFTGCYGDRSTIFKNTKCKSTNFSKAQLGGANFSSADLRYANLCGANFNVTDLTNTDLTKIEVDGRTAFGSVTKCESCKIDRITIENLNEKANFHISSLRAMNIRDDFAKMKLSFSGYLRSLHIISLILFLFPYTYFLLKCWSISSGMKIFNYDSNISNTDTIGGLFWEYFYTYGKLNDQWSWLTLISITLIIYNLNRIILLWKTMQLEHQSIVNGLPVSFELLAFWKAMYTVNKIGIFFNISLAIIHFMIFLNQPVLQI